MEKFKKNSKKLMTTTQKQGLIVLIGGIKKPLIGLMEIKLQQGLVCLLIQVVKMS